MGDIYLGIAIILTLSVGSLAAGLWLAHRASSRASILLTVGTAGSILFYVSWFRDTLFLAKALPFSNLVVIGDWLPLQVAFLSGLAWKLAPGRWWRKGALVGPFVLLTLYGTYGRFLGRPPACQDYWSESVCIQTSEASCSAASAATLLRAHGISATESEMAALCFTRESGTTMTGLYRGLKLKTEGTPWKVEVFFDDVDEMLAGEYTPSILKVGLKRGASSDPIYEQQWGWSRGQPHTVVLFGFTPDNKVKIGDPSIGREYWARKHLEALWMKTGVKLMKR